MIRRVYVEKKAGFDREGSQLLSDLRSNLGVTNLYNVRILQRYDVSGLDAGQFTNACNTVFSEPQVDQFTSEFPKSWEESSFAIEFLPGQFDQRADSARQCLSILTQVEKPVVKHAKIIILDGPVSKAELAAIKEFCINPVDSREASLDLPETLESEIKEPTDVEVLAGFRTKSAEELVSLNSHYGLAMSAADLEHIQKYYRDEEGRDPSITELRLMDTYWSDHCRHTTFLAELSDVKFDPNCPAAFTDAYKGYQDARDAVYGADTERPETLMDIACIAMKELRKTGELDNLEISEEINAASIVVPIEVDGKSIDYLVMFKNETHNHPTEIEPFGGAATCLGGAIRDPLSGRSYVYQAMRVTGAADPTLPYDQTLAGKLPQKKICTEAAEGYSSYGNQIGIATGQVAELYHPNFVAKRMEVGAVIAAAPKENVFRGSPATGDVILLLGGRTGRDGIGGATGSSKEHTETALENSAEVQKGNPPVERAVQRLFRNAELSKKIKVCNDFGAGGVSVAIGELAQSLQVDLDQVRKKYEGLDGTEIAISESQERMAVVIDPSDVDYFIQESDKENLECYKVADVTDSGRLIMTWRGKEIVNLSREFLDTNGVRQSANVQVTAPDYSQNPLNQEMGWSGHKELTTPATVSDKWIQHVGKLSEGSQKGLMEHFDGTIGANTLLHPYGGKNQLTPADSMAALIPVLGGTTNNCTFMSWGYNPRIASWSPFHGAVYAVAESVCRIVSSGGKLADIRLTLQEYFEKLGKEPQRWGKPFSALLGALHVQQSLRLAAIGGKDSMSGTFKDIDVPPTLVSFAVAPGLASHVISPEFKKAGNQVSLVQIKRKEDGLPDFDHLNAVANQLHVLIAKGRIHSAHSLGEGGIASGLTKMTIGNDIGVQLEGTSEDLFKEQYLNFLIEASPEITKELGATVIGTTIEQAEIKVGEETISLSDLKKSWLGTLEEVYPLQPNESGAGSSKKNSIPTISSESKPERTKAATSFAKPKVIIPTFPGTNCEYDLTKAFSEAGGEATTLIFRNLTQSAVEESLAALAQQIDESQILMLPGGFSAGDEPDGSGKFIAAALRNEQVKDSVHRLLYERDGLILGICNGFQALVKTGLLPYGEIKESKATDPTLTYNTIGRHIGRYAATRVSSIKSPWLSNCQVGDIHQIAFSHGEGRFVANPETMQGLIDNGQIATQYVDQNGAASMEIEANPNGSVYAVEGICSPDGRVLGKMGHNERKGPHLAKNIPGNKHQPLFRAGVEYFLD